MLNEAVEAAAFVGVSGAVPGPQRHLQRVERVRTDGDEALVRALQTFDHVGGASADLLRVSSDEFAAAHAEVPAQVVRAIGVAISRSQAFNREFCRAGHLCPASDFLAGRF